MTHTFTKSGPAIKSARRPVRVTFHALDRQGHPYVVGTVTWDGREAATHNPRGKPSHFLDEMADDIRLSADPDAYIDELPRRYKTAYLRAELG